jgi:hypothetical protein
MPVVPALVVASWLVASVTESIVSSFFKPLGVKEVFPVPVKITVP